MPNDVSSRRPRRRHPVTRFGVVGFLFFLIKGLLWLLVPLLIALWGSLGF